MDISFTCNRCGQSIVIDEAGAGKVDRVLKLSFTGKLRSQGFEIQVHWKVNGPTTIETRFPTDEEMDAFANTYRLFIQKNDALSICSLAKLYNGSLLTKTLADRFNAGRVEINSFLDSRSSFQTYTRRQIMETILYGEISHTNEKHRHLVKKWKLDQLIWSVVYLDFLKTAKAVLEFVMWAKKLNQEAIQGLRS